MWRSIFSGVSFWAGVAIREVTSGGVFGDPMANLGLMAYLVAWRGVTAYHGGVSG